MSSPEERKLRRLDPNEVPFGIPLPFDVFDEHATLFRQSGQYLRQTDLARYHKRLKAGLFVDISTSTHRGDESALSTIRALAALKPGDLLPRDVYDSHGVLLMAAGSQVNERFLRALRFREVSFGPPPGKRARQHPPQPRIEVREPVQPQSPDEPSAPILDAQALVDLDETLLESVEHQPSAKPADSGPRLNLHDLRQRAETGHVYYHQTVELFASVADDARHGRPPCVSGSTDLLTRMNHLTEQDPSLAMLLMDMRSAPNGEYLYNHGMNVALVAMQVARAMGWPQPQVQDLGIASLFQDLGMLDVPDTIRFAPRALSDDERAEIERHPAHTVQRLQRADGISPLSLLLAYQAHERCDQSGYPRRRGPQHIHPLARVLQAADLYAAVTCSRPHREARSPYTGMLALLREARDGRLDRQVVRAFLDSVSLFPIGSYVRLSDGSAARVIRSNGGSHGQPVVIPLNTDGTETDVELNLTATPSLSVVAALHAEEATGRIHPPLFAGVA